MGKKPRLVVRVIAAGLVCSFLLTEVAQAAPSVAQPVKVFDPMGFVAPAEFAPMKEIHRGDSGTFIIHIQDAHTNLSGQENLAKALDSIMGRYPVNLVLVEGGSQDDSLTALKSIAPPAVWKIVAKRFLMEGKISGEEYLNLTSDRPMKIMGIEDKALYFDSLCAYAALADKRGEVLDYLKTIQAATDKLKKKIYPQVLLDYEKSNVIMSEAKDRVSLDSSSPSAPRNDVVRLLDFVNSQNISLAEFPELLKLKSLHEEESRLDFDAANLEQAALLEAIHERGGGETLEKQLKESSEMKSAAASQFTYLQNAFNIARQKGIELSKYPHLAGYVDYLRGFSQLDLDAVLSESARAEDEVYESVISKSNSSSPNALVGDQPVDSRQEITGMTNKTRDALLLRGIDRYVKLLMTAYRIQMSAAEFQLMKVNEPDFTTRAYLAFLNRKLAENGYFQDLIPYDNRLDDGRKALGAFYDSVSRRDEAFIKNSEKILKAEHQKTAVLICGGYHTPHLKKLFREEGYSYAVLQPIVTSETDQARYEKILLAPIEQKEKRVEAAEGKILEGSSKDRQLELMESGARLAEVAETAARMAGTDQNFVIKILNQNGLKQANKLIDAQSGMTNQRAESAAVQRAMVGNGQVNAAAILGQDNVRSQSAKFPTGLLKRLDGLMAGNVGGKLRHALNGDLGDAGRGLAAFLAGFLVHYIETGLDGFANIFPGLGQGMALAHAAGYSGALGDIAKIFTLSNQNRVSHILSPIPKYNTSEESFPLGARLAATFTFDEGLEAVKSAIEIKRQELNKRNDNRPVYVMIDGDTASGKTAFSESLVGNIDPSDIFNRDIGYRFISLYENLQVAILHLDAFFWRLKDIYPSIHAVSINGAVKYELLRFSGKKIGLVVLEGINFRAFEPFLEFPIDISVHMQANEPSKLRNLMEREEGIGLKLNAYSIIGQPSLGSNDPAKLLGFLRNNTQGPRSYTYDFIIDNSRGEGSVVAARLAALPEGSSIVETVFDRSRLWATALKGPDGHYLLIRMNAMTWQGGYPDAPMYDIYLDRDAQKNYQGWLRLILDKDKKVDAKASLDEVNVNYPRSRQNKNPWAYPLLAAWIQMLDGQPLTQANAVFSLAPVRQRAYIAGDMPIPGSPLYQPTLPAEGARLSAPTNEIVAKIKALESEVDSRIADDEKRFVYLMERFAEEAPQSYPADASDPIVNEIVGLMSEILALPDGSEKFGKSILSRVDKEILPVLKERSHPWAAVFPSAEEWLLAPTLYYYLNENDYERITRRLARYVSAETLALRFGLFGPHLRTSLNLDVDAPDLESMKSFLDELMWEVVSNRRKGQENPEETLRISKGIVNGLIFREGHYVNQHYYWTLLSERPDGNGAEPIPYEKILGRVMGKRFDDFSVYQAKVAFIKKCIETVFGEDIAALAENPPRLETYLALDDSLYSYYMVQKLAQYNQAHPQETVSLGDVIRGEGRSAGFLAQRTSDIAAYQPNFDKLLKFIASESGARLAATRQSTVSPAVREEVAARLAHAYPPQIRVFAANALQKLDAVGENDIELPEVRSRLENLSRIRPDAPTLEIFEKLKLLKAALNKAFSELSPQALSEISRKTDALLADQAFYAVEIQLMGILTELSNQESRSNDAGFFPKGVSDEYEKIRRAFNKRNLDEFVESYPKAPEKVRAAFHENLWQIRDSLTAISDLILSEKRREGSMKLTESLRLQDRFVPSLPRAKKLADFLLDISEPADARLPRAGARLATPILNRTVVAEFRQALKNTGSQAGELLSGPETADYRLQVCLAFALSVVQTRPPFNANAVRAAFGADPRLNAVLSRLTDADLQPVADAVGRFIEKLLEKTAASGPERIDGFAAAIDRLESDILPAKLEAAKASGRPIVIVLTGLPDAGKSTFTAILLKRGLSGVDRMAHLAVDKFLPKVAGFDSMTRQPIYLDESGRRRVLDAGDNRMVHLLSYGQFKRSFEALSKKQLIVIDGLYAEALLRPLLDSGEVPRANVVHFDVFLNEQERAKRVEARANELFPLPSQGLERRMRISDDLGASFIAVANAREKGFAPDYVLIHRTFDDLTLEAVKPLGLTGVPAPAVVEHLTWDRMPGYEIAKRESGLPGRVEITGLARPERMIDIHFPVTVSRSAYFKTMAALNDRNEELNSPLLEKLSFVGAWLQAWHEKKFAATFDAFEGVVRRAASPVEGPQGARLASGRPGPLHDLYYSKLSASLGPDLSKKVLENQKQPDLDELFQEAEVMKSGFPKKIQVYEIGETEKFGVYRDPHDDTAVYKIVKRKWKLSPFQKLAFVANEIKVLEHLLRVDRQLETTHKISRIRAAGVSPEGTVWMRIEARRDAHDLDSERGGAIWGGLPLENKLDLLLQISRTLKAVHDAGVLHNDIKPKNILISVNGNGQWHLTLIDFDVSLLLKPDGSPQYLMIGGLFGGSEGYRPPEGFRKKYSDIYSWGIVMRKLLAPDRLPEPARTAYEALLQQMNEWFDKRRPQDMAEVIEKLETVQLLLKNGDASTAGARLAISETPGMISKIILVGNTPQAAADAKNLQKAVSSLGAQVKIETVSGRVSEPASGGNGASSSMDVLSREEAVRIADDSLSGLTASERASTAVVVSATAYEDAEGVVHLMKGAFEGVPVRFQTVTLFALGTAETQYLLHDPGAQPGSAWKAGAAHFTAGEIRNFLEEHEILESPAGWIGRARLMAASAAGALKDVLVGGVRRVWLGLKKTSAFAFYRLFRAADLVTLSLFSRFPRMRNRLIRHVQRAVREIFNRWTDVWGAKAASAKLSRALFSKGNGAGLGSVDRWTIHLLKLAAGISDETPFYFAPSDDLRCEDVSEHFKRENADLVKVGDALVASKRILDVDDYAELDDLIGKMKLPPRLKAQVEEMARELGGDIWIRSSHVLEDGTKHNYAGYLTSEHVKSPEDAADAALAILRDWVTKTWIGGPAGRPEGFPKLLSDQNNRMGFEIDRNIPHEVGGTFISGTHEDEERGFIYIEVGSSAQEAVSRTANTWKFIRSFNKQFNIEGKPYDTIAPMNEEGDEDISATPPLDDEKVERLAKGAKLLDLVFGHSQDGEFAWPKGWDKPYLFQNRPYLGVLPVFIEKDGSLTDRRRVAKTVVALGITPSKGLTPLPVIVFPGSPEEVLAAMESYEKNPGAGPYIGVMAGADIVALLRRDDIKAGADVEAPSSRCLVYLDPTVYSRSAHNMNDKDFQDIIRKTLAPEDEWKIIYANGPMQGIFDHLSLEKEEVSDKSGLSFYRSNEKLTVFSNGLVMGFYSAEERPQPVGHPLNIRKLLISPSEPAVTEPAAAAGTPAVIPQRPQLATGSELPILIVEDHDDTRTMLKLFISTLVAPLSLRPNIMAVGSFQEATEAMSSFHPLWIFSDMNTPGSRKAFLDAIRDKRAAGGGIFPEFVGMSGNASDDAANQDAHRLLSHDGNGSVLYIVKPNVTPSAVRVIVDVLKTRLEISNGARLADRRGKKTSREAASPFKTYPVDELRTIEEETGRVRSRLDGYRRELRAAGRSRLDNQRRIQRAYEFYYVHRERVGRALELLTAAAGVLAQALARYDEPGVLRKYRKKMVVPEEDLEPVYLESYRDLHRLIEENQKTVTAYRDFSARLESFKQKIDAASGARLAPTESSTAYHFLNGVRFSSASVSVPQLTADDLRLLAGVAAARLSFARPVPMRLAGGNGELMITAAGLGMPSEISLDGAALALPQETPLSETASLPAPSQKMAAPQSSVSDFVQSENMDVRAVLDAAAAIPASKLFEGPIQIALPLDAIDGSKFDDYLHYYAAVVRSVRAIDAAKNVSFFLKSADPDRLDQAWRRLRDEEKVFIGRAPAEGVAQMHLSLPTELVGNQPYLPLAPFGVGNRLRLKAYILLAIVAGRWTLAHPDHAAPPESLLNVYGQFMGKDLRSQTGELTSALTQFLSGRTDAAARRLAEIYALPVLEPIGWNKLLQFFQNAARMAAQAA